MSKEAIPKFIRRLMSNETEEAQREAAENFRQYMKVLFRIYERIVRERDTDSTASDFRDRVDDSLTI